jgi:hypothetical protein
MTQNGDILIFIKFGIGQETVVACINYYCGISVEEIMFRPRFERGTSTVEVNASTVPHQVNCVP